MTRRLLRRALLTSLVFVLVSGFMIGIARTEEPRGVQMQGTWQGEDGGVSGTWQMHFRMADLAIMRADSQPTKWESFEGTMSAPGIPGFDGEQEVVGWAVSGNIGFRLVRSGWENFIFSGSLDGSKVSGKYSTPDGRSGRWEGWWIAPKTGSAGKSF